MTSVLRIPEYKHAQLEYKHVCHRRLSPLYLLDGTDTLPQLSKRQRVFLVLRQRAGLVI